MEKVKISSTHECAEFLRAYGKRKKECMGVVCLDADYSVVSKKIIAEGNDHDDMMGSGEKKNAKVARVSRTQEVFS